MTEIKYVFDFDPFGEDIFPIEEKAKLASITHASFVQSIDTTPIFHALWDEIHSKRNPDSEWWESIRARVRKIVCKCDAFLDKYITDNPLRFNDWPKYSWTLHNAVNHKLSKTEFSWAEFETKYG